MINNRQNGRRRGRGGSRMPSGGGGSGSDRGNRIDNRARGNAAQLLEKYKTLARDAQMQGDRVNTEYYLQFADHYFRVLSESRARFEEQQQQQRPRRDEFSGANDFQHQGDYQEEFDDEGELNGSAMAAAPNGEDRERGGQRRERFERQDRYERQDRPDRNFQNEGGDRDRRPARFDQAERGEQASEGERFDDRRPRGRRERRPQAEDNRDTGYEATIETPPVQIDERPEEASRPRRGRPRRQPVENGVEAGERIEVDRLPPAFAADAPLLAGVVEAEPAAAEKPRRRTRRPRSDEVAADA